MSARVAHRIAHTAATAPCARCLTVDALAAGAWHAVDPAADGRHVCDGCAQRDDPHGYAQLLAWRRMATGTRRTAA